MIRSLCIAAAFVILATPVVAKEIPDGGVTVKDIVDWSEMQGFDAKAEKSPDGQGYVVGGTGGVRWTIWTYDCKGSEGRCSSVQVVSSFDAKKKMTPEDYNTWNRDKRFARAYPEKDGSPSLSYDINVSPGGTWEAFEDNINVWRQMSDEYFTYLNP
jgi:hypothetical protein